MEMPQVYRPIPRRTFEIPSTSTDSSMPPSPASEGVNGELPSGSKSDSTPGRTRSILNLTSSTLLGIYSPISDGNREDLSTPWGTGAQTPSKRQSIDDSLHRKPEVTWQQDGSGPRLKPKPKRRGFPALVLQTALLFTFGLGYGSIVTHLHKTRRITPVPVPDVEQHSVWYLISWGIFGILLGNALPLLDAVWEGSGAHGTTKNQGTSNTKSATVGSDETDASDGGLGPMWYSAVRSIGVFVGIAFAVRRLPWQSTLQVALTLALANPFLWYLLDRSLPGFAFSAIVSVAGTLVLLLVDPNFVPVPAIHQQVVSDQFGVYTWLASILFCTSICFGAIGRRLQL
ncbi:hypothetical protein PV08_04823 [Exophiala spinifera]|uniref:INSIG domain-containing protein n=1 Tax=Exophiala spinifera TaxID=91928 RepID=A0A0D2BF70_9EURO|nr:uncharacterized protein PV08_04823 [Exophiala spinifera]KIW17628.1 hypothetical protein PV08_04823 [Exophiala spinifera]